MAPESVADEGNVGEHLDVFSLGAIAYHLFSGVAPAANGLELSNKLRETKGLQISSVLNGASENLQFLVRYSTHPEVANRIDSVIDFLSYLDEVEDELTTPEQNFVEDRLVPDQRSAARELHGSQAPRPGRLLGGLARRARQRGVCTQGGQRSRTQPAPQRRERNPAEITASTYRRVLRHACHW